MGHLHTMDNHTHLIDLATGIIVIDKQETCPGPKGQVLTPAQKPPRVDKNQVKFQIKREI